MHYAELHCLSNFTFLRGASHPEELVSKAHELGYATLAITDECSLAGVVRAHAEAKRCEFPIVIATDRASYGHIAALVTRGRRAADKGSYRLTRGDVGAMPGCLALWLPGRSP